MAENQEKMVGKEIEIIVDEYDNINDLYICRSVYDAPEIDGEVYISGEYDMEIGNIYKAVITESDVYDLYGELCD